MPFSCTRDTVAPPCTRRRYNALPPEAQARANLRASVPVSSLERARAALEDGDHSRAARAWQDEKEG